MLIDCDDLFWHLRVFKRNKLNTHVYPMVSEIEVFLGVSAALRADIFSLLLRVLAALRADIFSLSPRQAAPCRDFPTRAFPLQTPAFLNP